VEIPVLTIGATGEARDKSIYDAPREYSFADLKGDLDAIGDLAGGFTWNTNGSHRNASAGQEWPSATNRGTVYLGDPSIKPDILSEAKNLSTIGEAGQLARRVADRLKLRQDVFLAELQLDPFYAAFQIVKESRRYVPLPRFPAVERDFSLLLPDGAQFSDITNAIRSLKIAEVASIQAVDLYRGKNMAVGKYSLLVRVTFQSREATLTDAQITDFSTRIISTLEKQLHAQLRAQ
jgi:phenylalanyl-tRNA synthetase beta subunit